MMLSTLLAGLPIHLPAADATPGQGQFLGVDWGAFVIVFLVSIVACGIVVSFFSIGIKLLSLGSADDPSGDSRGPKPTTEQVAAARAARPLAATITAYVCFAICIAAVIFGILLVIPPAHLPSFLWFGRQP
jgi:hypothetical protein